MPPRPLNTSSPKPSRTSRVSSAPASEHASDHASDRPSSPRAATASRRRADDRNVQAPTDRATTDAHRFVPAAADAAIGPLLGGLTAAQFMRRYWQRKPLLIRGAVPDIAQFIDRETLFGLADRDDVDSRLITQRRGTWSLDHGPFARDELPSARSKQWTLLVQGVNLYHDATHALMNRFRFLPDARLDDAMYSYATDGGGVGPHFDSYDVFLLQTHGKRRWRISAQRDLALQEGMPLKILDRFEPTQEWVLEPGDMLYLPPHIAHDGVAIGECMTCSIGFRAPVAGEMMGQFLFDFAERADTLKGAARRLQDKGREPTTTPARLPDDVVDTTEAWLRNIQWNRADVERFVGRYLSEPKPNVVFDTPDNPPDEAGFLALARRRGIAVDPRTALLYDRHCYYINGEAGKLDRDVRDWVQRLADRKALEGKDFVTLSGGGPVTGLLHEWYCAGWIRAA
ncbi:50S ribosomal protein L16 3-hydroxylase [Pararobbsia alpina]